MHVIAATDINAKDELLVSYTSPLLSTPMRQVSFFNFFVEYFHIILHSYQIFPSILVEKIFNF